MRIVIDSYAWIELFLGSSMGSKVRELIETADESFTPDSVLAEVSRKYVREGAAEKLVEADDGSDQSVEFFQHLFVSPYPAQ